MLSKWLTRQDRTIPFVPHSMPTFDVLKNKMESFYSLIIGITSSLFATALFISISEFIRKVLLPWYADKIYRGIRIDGSWGDAESAAEGDQGLLPQSLILEQNGDQITGEFSFRAEVNQELEVYKVTGIIRDGIFSAMMRSKSAYHLDALTILTRIGSPHDRLEMKGAVSFLDSDSVKINVAQDFHFIRET
jgi:hypothetical protein